MNRTEIKAEYRRRIAADGWDAAEAWYADQRDNFPGGWVDWTRPAHSDGKQFSGTPQEQVTWTIDGPILDLN